LGYTFNKRATNCKAHIREIGRKVKKVVGCVWEMGERKWEGDFRRRMMFGSVTESVWSKNLGREGTRRGRKVQENFLRGVPGNDRETPGCIVRE
jgi:hypothetical protein